MSWSTILKALVAYAAQGAAIALSAAWVDPQHFDLFTVAGLTEAAKVAATGAFTAVLLYLRQSPLPKPWDGTERREDRPVTGGPIP